MSTLKHRLCLLLDVEQSLRGIVQCGLVLTDVSLAGILLFNSA